MCTDLLRDRDDANRSGVCVSYKELERHAMEHGVVAIEVQPL